MTNRWTGFVATQTRIAFIGFLVFGGLITAPALADRIFGLGWGYGQWDALMGLGIMVWGCVVYFLCTLVFRLFR